MRVSSFKVKLQSQRQDKRCQLPFGEGEGVKNESGREGFPKQVLFTTLKL